MKPIRGYLSYANIVATVALVFAMGGSAVAASHYLITSTSQISPKVLKRLVGAAGKTGGQGQLGAQGQTGAPGAAGTPGNAGTPGKEGTQGNEGPRGPSDVYEVVLAKSLQAETPGGVLVLTLSNLPAGAYEIFGKASLEPSERKTGATSCTLEAEGDQDNTEFNFTSPDFGEEAAPITTQLTHTFPSTGTVRMYCRFDSAINWLLTTNPSTRIVAIRIGSEHKTSAEAVVDP